MKSLLLVALLAVCVATAVSTPMVALETSAKSRAPFGWSRVRSYEDSDSMIVHIAIKQSNVDRLEVRSLLHTAFEMACSLRSRWKIRPTFSELLHYLSSLRSKSPFVWSGSTLTNTH